MGEAEFNSFHIIRIDFEGIDDLEHEEECWGRAVSLFVFLLGKLPISHDVPHDLVFIERRLLKLFVFKVYDLEESEHLSTQTPIVDAKLSNYSRLDVCESIIAFNSDKDTVSDRQVDRNRYLSFAHQGHHLILDRHITDNRWIIDLPHHLLEQIPQILFFLFAASLLLEFVMQEEETCHDEVLIRNVDMQKDSHRLVDSNRSQFMRSVTLLDEL